jgi:branched-chain amino acid transport system permease protein
MLIFSHLLVGAIILGTLYAMVAVGFSLYFGVVDLIQFGHGALFMLGGFFAIALSSWAGLESVALLVIVPIVLAGIVGVVFAKITVQPLLKSPALITLLATLAGGQVIRELIRIFYPNGSSPQPFPNFLPAFRVDIGPLMIPGSGIIVLVFGLIAMFVTIVSIQRSRLGRRMRAVSQDREAAQMMGTNLSMIVSATFFIASTLAALAGILYGLYYNTVQYNMGVTIGVIGFAAATVGGLGSLYGAVLGGYLFAFVETFASGYLPMGSEYSQVIAFVILIVFIVFRPEGILGERVSERV